MPAFIRLAVNEKDISDYKVVRIAGTTDPDSINTYLVYPRQAIVPSEVAVRFKHRYGDGLEVCAAKALLAWVERKKK